MNHPVIDFPVPAPRRLARVACRVFRAAIVFGVFGFASPVAAGGAEPGSLDRPIRVFLDCGASCRFDFIRTEISFVDWVRQREEADVHVIVAQEPNGGGGRRMELRFLGRGLFQGTDDTLFSTTERGEPDERVQTGLVQTLRLGLVRYLARTPAGRGVAVSVSQTAKARPVHDPWNNWVFTVRADGQTELQETQKSYWLRGSVSADRVTEEWKMSLYSHASRSESRFDTDEGEVRSLREDRDVRAFAVNSLGSHFSAGGDAWYSHSTFRNVRRSLGASSAVEYDVYPYSQSSRRQFRISYALELRDMRYIEETVYLKKHETLVRHELSATLERRDPWGTLQGRLEAGQYFHDLRRYRIEVSSEASLRVAHGFSLYLSGDLAVVRDRLSLPRRDATVEEILLRQRQLASGYETQFRVGLSYTFGSIYNSVVNPRFGH